MSLLFIFRVILFFSLYDQNFADLSSSTRLSSSNSKTTSTIQSTFKNSLNAPNPDRAVNAYLGWPLEIHCKFDKSDEILWYRYDTDFSFKIQLGLNAKNDFYYVEKNLLLIPIVRQNYENNSIFECMSKTKSKSESIKIVVNSCENSPCKSGKCSLMNENEEVPMLSCDCNEGYEGELCDKEISKAPTFTVAGFGCIFAIFLIIISTLILKKRTTEHVIRKSDNVQQAPSQMSPSSQVKVSQTSKMKAKQSSKVKASQSSKVQPRHSIKASQSSKLQHG